MPKVTKLDSGCWHVRWGPDRWLQWPVGRPARMGDGFGWLTQSNVDEANRLTGESDA